jgi:hypothetical protein
MTALLQSSRDAGLQPDKLAELQTMVDAEREWLKAHDNADARLADSY